MMTVDPLDSSASRHVEELLLPDDHDLVPGCSIDLCPYIIQYQSTHIAMHV
jgi:hypothetical protein